MKGVILAGGSGTRLYPTTQLHNKGLLPVYDKPMVYYPLCTLIENGISDICLISSPEYIDGYRKVLEHAEDLGINICYKVQEKPEGIAQSFLLAEDFIGNDNVSLILGDNIFSGGELSLKRAFNGFKSGGVIFGYEVKNPSDYGVIQFNQNGTVDSVVEKPVVPPSNYAVPGLYLFDYNVVQYAKEAHPSDRGELEITSVINRYVDTNNLKAIKLSRGCAWLDAGTPKSLHESSEYIKVIEERQGIKIGCIEEAALNSKLITTKELKEVVSHMPISDYRSYLERIL